MNKWVKQTQMKILNGWIECGKLRANIKNRKPFFNFLRWQLLAPPKHQQLLEEHEDPYYSCRADHHTV